MSRMLSSVLSAATETKPTAHSLRLELCCFVMRSRRSRSAISEVPQFGQFAESPPTACLLEATQRDPDAAAERAAHQLRQHGHKVNQPAIKAIKAVLLVLGKVLNPTEAVRRAGTTFPSLSKYRPLVESMLQLSSLPSLQISLKPATPSPPQPPPSSSVPAAPQPPTPAPPQSKLQCVPCASKCRACPVPLPLDDTSKCWPEWRHVERLQGSFRCFARCRKLQLRSQAITWDPTPQGLCEVYEWPYPVVHPLIEQRWPEDSDWTFFRGQHVWVECGTFTETGHTFTVRKHGQIAELAPYLICGSTYAVEVVVDGDDCWKLELCDEQGDLLPGCYETHCSITSIKPLDLFPLHRIEYIRTSSSLRLLRDAFYKAQSTCGCRCRLGSQVMRQVSALSLDAHAVFACRMHTRQKANLDECHPYTCACPETDEWRQAYKKARWKVGEALGIPRGGCTCGDANDDCRRAASAYGDLLGRMGKVIDWQRLELQRRRERLDSLKPDFLRIAQRCKRQRVSLDAQRQWRHVDCATEVLCSDDAPAECGLWHEIAAIRRCEDCMADVFRSVQLSTPHLADVSLAEELRADDRTRERVAASGGSEDTLLKLRAVQIQRSARQYRLANPPAVVLAEPFDPTTCHSFCLTAEEIQWEDAQAASQLRKRKRDSLVSKVCAAADRLCMRAQHA